MKKLTAAIAALALYFSASAFGPNPGKEVNALLDASASKAVTSGKVGKLITSAFKDKFENASTVNWRESQGLYFGYFKQGEQNFTVAYTTDGELFATAKQLSVNELPQPITDKLNQSFADCSITGSVTEIDMEGSTGYYVTVENKTSSKLLKFYSDGSVEVVKKTNKKVLKGTVS